MPALTLPAADPALAVRDVAGAAVGRRLTVLTRDRPTAPALDALLAAVTRQAARLGSGPASPAAARARG